MNILGDLGLDLKILALRTHAVHLDLCLAFKRSFVHSPLHHLVVDRRRLRQIRIVDTGHILLVDGESVVHAGVDTFIVHLLLIIVIELGEVRLLIDYTA